MAAVDCSVMTCTACRLRLRGVDARNAHYRSELHTANLRRKVAGVPAYTEEEFNQVQQKIALQKTSAKRERQAHFCEVCSKKFSSLRALENHRNSRRHQEAVRKRPMSDISGAASASEAISIEPADEDAPMLDEAEIAARMQEATAIPATVCVFDGHASGSVEENVAYMAAKFGFFVPYIESLTDLEGLLTYIGQKVGVGYCCVECDRTFTSLAAVRRHMIDKEHCRMTSDDDVWVEEYGEFYDFGAEGDDESEAGWEEVPEGEMADGADEMAVTVAVATSLSRRGALVAGPAQHNADEVSMAVNGKVLGHRSLQRYYKQSYAKAEVRDSVLISKVAGEYRLMGWGGQKKLPMEVRAKRVERMKKFKYELSVGRKNYYTRKAALKPSMAVFNSGYRP